MQRLEITDFGPIKTCCVEINDFMVITGEQASGKSTVAKCIFYFNHLKDILSDMIQRNIGHQAVFQSLDLEKDFVREAKRIFIQSFGLEFMPAGSSSFLSFDYGNDHIVAISLEQMEDELSVIIELDEEIKKLIAQLSGMLNDLQKIDMDKILEFINIEIFGNDMDIVFIPAGRSLLTMLSSQISYLYAKMDEQQRKAIDYTTQCYLEEVFRIKDFFRTSPARLIKQVEATVDYEINLQQFKKAAQLTQKILCGEYRNVNGEERLYYTADQSVAMNYASSGQQEAVWLTNTLLYHLLGRRKTWFIIEEPESHLFPGTQKTMVELISLVKNGKNKVVITTHSPYVLGSINNLLYAHRVSDLVDKDRLRDIVPENLWLDFGGLGAYYLENGKMDDITDPEFKDIDNDVIDGVSSEINDVYEEMVRLKDSTLGGGPDAFKT